MESFIFSGLLYNLCLIIIIIQLLRTEDIRNMEGMILNLCSMLTWISLSEIVFVFVFVYSCLFILILDDKFHICMIYGM